jgi:adenosylcobinamide-GDP ribazoletransferase
VGVALGVKALWVMLAAVAITAASGAYYQHRIGGVTGDCLGATNQIAELAVYLTGVILR